MIFQVKRLHQATESGRRYHLFDEEHHLLLVAEQGSAWLPDEPHRVRFARPNGEQIASLDLPKAGSPSNRATSYAIIFNHAVYALLNEVSADPGALPDYLLEVEGDRWLMMRHEEDSIASFHLYDQFPADMKIYAETELAEPIGAIRTAANDYDFTISLPAERLSQPALVALALVAIVDGSPLK